MITDQDGHAVGFGEAGAGNHEVVGYDGLIRAVSTACAQAYTAAGIRPEQISGAGFGVSGLDWASEKAETLESLRTAGIAAPLDAVNDTILGLLAGSEAGWGLAIVSGSGCNCRGWDREHRREGMVTGHGFWMGEGAGGAELIVRAVQSVSHEWTRRGPATALSPALIDLVGAKDLEDLVEGITQERYTIHASAAPLVFQAAAEGDAVACGLVRWAGCELGELAKAVIRQLAFEELEFDVILIGSMFKAGAALIEPLRETILSLAPGARLKPLTAPPVIGAVILGMEQGEIQVTPEIRRSLIDSFARI